MPLSETFFFNITPLTKGKVSKANSTNRAAPLSAALSIALCRLILFSEVLISGYSLKSLVLLKFEVVALPQSKSNKNVCVNKFFIII
jgi:hypothetical protein